MLLLQRVSCWRRLFESLSIFLSYKVILKPKNYIFCEVKFISGWDWHVSVPYSLELLLRSLASTLSGLDVFMKGIEIICLFSLSYVCLFGLSFVCLVLTFPSEQARPLGALPSQFCPRRLSWPLTTTTGCRR